MATKKKTSKKRKTASAPLTNFKPGTQEQLDQMRLNADLYTNGNLSAWLRFSATAFEPSKAQLKAFEAEMNKAS